MANLPARFLRFPSTGNLQHPLCTRGISTSSTRLGNGLVKSKKKQGGDRVLPRDQYGARVSVVHAYRQNKLKDKVPIKRRFPKPLDYSELDPEFYDDRPVSLELEDFVPENVFTAHLGEPLAYTRQALAAFKAFGQPSSSKWNSQAFSQPFSVVRDSTVKLLTELNVRSQQVRDQPAPNGLILHGSSGCGKSTLLMQAVSHCLANGWIVLYVPRGIDLVTSSSRYEYDARTKLFNLSAASHAMIKSMLAVNGGALKKIQADQDIVYGDKEQVFEAGGDLAKFAEAALQDDTANHAAALDALVGQLGRQTEIPVLLAADDYQCLYVQSMYRDQQYIPIWAYHLSLPRLLLEYAIGTRPLKRGLVLGALGPLHTNFAAPVPLREAIGAEISWKAAVDGPFAVRHQAHVHYSQGLQGFAMPAQLEVEAAKGWYHMMTRGGVLHTRPSDDFFLAKYTEASGNAREFGRAMLSTLQ
ncbi:hypothetical protein CALCODRAFT_166829 [Calocera cornea HHB12733]|uniref:Small ribosomal subunit protein mS29 n=1 Tax=Calocera cornea HHB12733 TaxID=1353952 RepID=A0A165HXV5_9BASI|nr:hypothetical protein CALCODRAFT_166829 [Calocera cornea HHB12733]